MLIQQNRNLVARGLNMIERIADVRDNDCDRNPIGVVVLQYLDGHFGVGVSLCKTDEDRFDKATGKGMAQNRAQICYVENPLLLKDIVKLGIDEFFEFGGVKFTPTNNTSEETYERLVHAFETYLNVVDDMIYTLALAKVKSETM